MFELLPIELIIEILAQLSSADLRRAAQVCQEWHALIPPNSSIICSDYSTIPTLPAVDEKVISVWKRRAEIYFSSWLPLLPKYCDCRWLCSAGDSAISSSQRFTGLGRKCVTKICVNDGTENQVVYEYLGEFVNGEYDGTGILRSTSKTFDFYSGTWKAGLEHGYGKFSWKPRGKMFYIGECKDGFRDGYGIYQWDETKKYIGFHRANKLWGRGIFTYKNAMIDGEWKADKKHGLCTIVWPPEGPSGKFVGHYEHDTRAGIGSYFWADGAVYTGEWKGVDRHGQGKMQFANGVVWEGKYRYDVREGPGRLTWTDTGDVFIGTWVAGARQGSGTFIDGNSGKVVEQFWKSGEDVIEYSKGVIKSPIGTLTNGHCILEK
jgi:hypothetical protein